MGYRDLEERRLLQLERTRRNRTRRALLWIYLIILIAYALLGLRLASSGGNVGSSFSAEDDAVVLTFGKSRQPIVRSAIVPMTMQPNSTATVVSVRLTNDPRGGTRQFPAGQIVLGANPVTASTVSLTVSADPWTPERVKSGVYRGNILLSSGTASTQVPLVLAVGSREGYWAITAFSIVLLGAILGLMIKWITERLTPQAAAYRRLVAMRRAVGWGQDGKNLPMTARLRLEELEDLIARQDYGPAEQIFSELDQRRGEIAVITSQIGILYDILDTQAKAIDRSRKKLTEAQLGRVDAVLDDEYRQLVEAQSIEWPGNADNMNRMLQDIRPRFIISGQIISSFLVSPRQQELRDAVILLQRGEYQEAQVRYAARPRESDSDAGAATESETKPTRGSHSGRDGWRIQEPSISVWFRLARPIAGAASVVVVALVGLKTQYLDNQGFDDDLSTWVNIGLWGLAVELSGVSVVDVLSRLASSGAAVVKPPPGQR